MDVLNNSFYVIQCVNLVPIMIFSNHVEYLHRVKTKLFTSNQNILLLFLGPLYLNRQTIVLLSHRHVHDIIFLLLQQEHHLWLIESLLYPSITYDFLYDKLTRNFFPLRELFLDGQFNLAEEPFFRQLIVTFIHHDLIKMKEKSRTRIPKQSARNLIGVVDEYGVLVRPKKNISLKTK